MSFMDLPVNEPVKDYGPDDSARVSLRKKLKELGSEQIEIPCIIGGKKVFTGKKIKLVKPHSHSEVIAEAHLAGEKEITLAIEAAAQAKTVWEAMPPKARADIFLNAAKLLQGKYRDILNASSMLGQSKNVYQAEIDASCELIDFFNFNSYFYGQILENQPLSVSGIKNSLDYRPLEGFVAAITPFNFTSIAANLPAAPALCGNTTLWKPSDTQIYSAHFTMQLFEEAGLPPGVINFLPADGPLFGKTVFAHHELAGVHFTGSTATFQHIWKAVSENLGSFRTYPRLVGETGGKDFVFAHPSANLEVLAVALVRGAFEYQGQKCSAASRAYIPRSLWPTLKERLVADVSTIKMGDVEDFSNFMNAVIDSRSYEKITRLVSKAVSAGAKVITGGSADNSVGYFIEPTILETTDPKSVTMVEELFGPVLTVYVYDDAKLDETLKLLNETSPYALTGAVIADDMSARNAISLKLRNAAGNFYLNDKPTGAVVGQQPFGGARASGTNDKAGSLWNLIRWISPRTIKENLNPPKDYRYPFLKEP